MYSAAVTSDVGNGDGFLALFFLRTALSTKPLSIPFRSPVLGGLIGVGLVEPLRMVLAVIDGVKNHLLPPPFTSEEAATGALASVCEALSVKTSDERSTLRLTGDQDSFLFIAGCNHMDGNGSRRTGLGS